MSKPILDTPDTNKLWLLQLATWGTSDLELLLFAPCLMPKWHRVHSETTQWSVNSFIRNQIINNLSFAGQEAKAKT